MPPPSKFKRNLQAQAALARCSRTSKASNAQSPTPSKSVPTSPSSHTACTAPSNTPDAVFGEKSNESNDSDVQDSETFENVCLHLPDTHEGLEEDGYHTDDDLSELEDEDLIRYTIFSND